MDGPKRTMPEETRRKISEALKGTPKGPHSAEQKARMREAHLGKTHSEETKRKISESEKGKVVSEETRQKIRAAKLGRKRPEMRGQNHPKARQINQLTLDGRLVRRWDCMREITDDPQFPSAQSIRACCRGSKASYKGFGWEYAETKD